MGLIERRISKTYFKGRSYDKLTEEEKRKFDIIMQRMLREEDRESERNFGGVF